MAAEFPIRFFDNEGDIVPTFICALCGEPISDAFKNGWIGFYDQQTSTAIPRRAAVILHKNVCMPAWEEKYGNFNGDHEFDHVLDQLIHNSYRHTSAEDREARRVSRERYGDLD
ncbi:MAG: hypothetical protein ABIY70_04810 [Capsulimonas sp.]|uniref:hypothetical protein n=1 Tax=Capsulimonas sp. TaxID=2494211 RepID=UPI003263A24B